MKCFLCGDEVKDREALEVHIIDCHFDEAAWIIADWEDGVHGNVEV